MNTLILNPKNVSDVDIRCPKVITDQQPNVDFIPDEENNLAEKLVPFEDAACINPELVSKEYDLILSEDIKDEPTSDDNLLTVDQTSSQGGRQGKVRGHHKQGSDCTLIDGLQQEIELLNKNNDNLDATLTEEPGNNMDATPTRHDKNKADSNPLTNFVSFIRTNSLRLKRNLNKEYKEDTKIKEILPQPSNHESPALLSKIVITGANEAPTETPAKKMVHSRSFSEFEEICRSAHGLLRKSEPGPITFHTGGSQTKFSKIRNSGLNKTFPCRSRSKFENADSGFESCTSSIVFERDRRKKCAVPLLLQQEVSRSAGYDSDFQFRENNSPQSLLKCEAMLPALTDVSDDDSEEKPELFFGKFPCKPKIPFKTAQDIYQAQTQYLEFSDSDSDEPFSNIKRVGRKSYLPSTSRSSSSGSSISREDIKRILNEWSFPCETASDSENTELVISPCPGDHESLQRLFSEGVETVEMVCESGSENKILTGRIVLWTPEYKQKIKKVFISRQKAGSATPDNSIKLTKDDGNWTICTPAKALENTKTSILLTVETDTERSESISTTATSPIYEDEHNDENFDTDEELYFNMREQMKNLDRYIDNTPNQDDLPCSVIDYMNRDMP